MFTSIDPTNYPRLLWRLYLVITSGTILASFGVSEIISTFKWHDKKHIFK